MIQDYERVLQVSKQAEEKCEGKPLESAPVASKTLQVRIVGREAEMRSLAQEKLQEIQDREWIIRWKGKDVFNVRKKVNQLVGVIQKFSGLVEAAASQDPLHAGLAWAGICVILPVGQRNLSHCHL